MAKKKNKIEPGVLVSIQGNVQKEGAKAPSGDHYDEIGRVVSIEDQIVTLILEESEKKVKATTWIGNVEYYCQAPKFDIGDLVTLVPLKIVDIETDDGKVRYEIQLGEDRFDTTYVDEKLISQVLSKV